MLIDFFYHYYISTNNLWLSTPIFLDSIITGEDKNLLERNWAVVFASQEKGMSHESTFKDSDAAAIEGLFWA